MSKLCTWTEFQVPESEPIFEISDQYAPSEARQKWVRVICPLAEAPGFEGGCWWRIKEFPETLVLCARWTSPEALEAFRASPEYAGYIEGISLFAPPLEMVLNNRGAAKQWLGFRKWISLLRVTFPRQLSEEQRRKVRMLDGLYIGAGFAPGAEYEWPWYQAHVAWASKKEGQGKESTEGTTEPLFWFHSWVNFEREEEWKRTGTKYFHSEESRKQHLPPEEYFDKSIRRLGAVEWRQEHYFEFKDMPTVFNGEPSIGRFLRNGKVIASGTVLER